MKKRKITTIFSLVLIVTMLFSVSAMAASKAPKKIKLSTKKLTMAVGDKTTLKVTFTPTKANKKVKWSTSNKKVATVSSKGKIAAKSVGKATITCTSKAKKKVKAACKVTVVKEGIKLEKITLYDDGKKLSEDNILLSIGYSYTLHPKFTPLNTTYTDVTWTSSDTSIVTVDKNGKCTGVKGGKATVTCTSVKFPKITAVCQVEVMKDRNAQDDENLLAKFKTILAGTGEPLYQKLQGKEPRSKSDAEGKTIWSINTNLNGTINYISIYERGTYNTVGETYCMYSSPSVTFDGTVSSASSTRSALLDGTYDYANDPDKVIVGWSMFSKDTTKDALEKIINGKITDEIYNKLIEYSSSWTATRAGGGTMIIFGKNKDGKLTGRYAGNYTYNMPSNAASFSYIGIAEDNADTYGVASSGTAMY